MSKRNPLSPPALTRRRFLEQLGAVGGSSLVFSAMTSWDLMAGSAGQKPELTGHPAKSKVLVLGGGLSGMVVGYELGKLGYDYQVLEARERVGGLQWAVQQGRRAHRSAAASARSAPSTKGQYINVGPWRIPYSHEAVLELLQGAQRSGAGVPQRIRRELFLLRRQRRRAAVEQEDPAARDQGRRHRARSTSCS